MRPLHLMWGTQGKMDKYLYQCIMQVSALYPGDHVEIGTRLGHSAAIAAAFREYGTVYCIDPMKVPFTNEMAERLSKGANVLDQFRTNMEDLNLEDRVKLTIGMSDPWPWPEDQRFVTGLIDGSHDHPWPIIDWNNMKKVVDKVIVIDDTLIRGATPAIIAAQNDPDWNYQPYSKYVGYAWRKDAAV